MWTELFFDLHDLEVFNFTATLCMQTLPPGGAAGTPAEYVCQVCAGPVAPRECGCSSVTSRCIGTEVVGGGVPVAMLMGHPLAAPLVAC